MAARLPWEQEDASSSLATPTIYNLELGLIDWNNVIESTITPKTQTSKAAFSASLPRDVD
jgi:hypothetical protein